MKKLLTFALLLNLLESAIAAPLAVKGEYVVKIKSTSTKSVSAFKQRLSFYGMKVKEVLDKKNTLQLLKMNPQKEFLSTFGLSASASNDKIRSAVLNEFSKFNEVELIEPNYIYTASLGRRPPTPPPPPPPPTEDPEERLPSLLPQDPSFARLWGMRNLGQSDSSNRRGAVGADIDANNAWAITTGSRNVIVAVVDSGVDYKHPDLKANMWSMPGQPNVHGYNAINNSLDPMDDNNHGTHVAGTIGAVGDNDVGVAGVNWKVSIMGIKFLDADGSGDLAAAIKGIDWARQNGAQVMNNSWGGGPFSQNLLDAIKRARDAGILFVAAAGNTSGGHNNDSSPSYPASYNLDNVISVASTNNLDQLSSFSHYGVRSVHLAAPGENIYSTFPNSRYESISGTSMATPHVTGAAALLLAKESQLSYLEVKSRLLNSADRIAALKSKTQTGARLNIYKALIGVDARQAR